MGAVSSEMGPTAQPHCDGIRFVPLPALKRTEILIHTPGKPKLQLRDGD